MRRKLTILLVAALVAVLAIGALAPAVSAHGDTDADEQPPYSDANATETRAEQMAYWMETRMGPEGVESFEAQTGVSIDEFAHAMAEHMGPVVGNDAPRSDDGQYGPGSGDGYQTPRWGNGPQMPCGGWGGMGSSGGFGPGASYGGGFGGGYGPGGHGPGMGGNGMMGGGW